MSDWPELWWVWQAGPRVDALMATVFGIPERPYSTDMSAVAPLIPRLNNDESGARCVLICDANGTWHAAIKPGGAPFTYDGAQLGHGPAHAVCNALLMDEYQRRAGQ
jgi:hypothetical protein